MTSSNGIPALSKFWLPYYSSFEARSWPKPLNF